MKFLLPLFLLLTAPAFAANNIGQFTGSYVLTNDRLGICDPSVRVWSSEGLDGDSFQMWVGSYFFRNVNAGTQRFENEFEKGSSVSTYRNNTLTFSRNWFHKIKRVNERQRITASFRGERLHIVSRLWGSPPTERDCSYRRLPEVNDDFGDVIDNSDGSEFRRRGL